MYTYIYIFYPGTLYVSVALLLHRDNRPPVTHTCTPNPPSGLKAANGRGASSGVRNSPCPGDYQVVFFNTPAQRIPSPRPINFSSERRVANPVLSKPYGFCGC